MLTELKNGIYNVMPTFFKENDELDITRIVKHFEFLVNNEIKNFVFLGTTSETPTLSLDEMKILINKFNELKNDDLNFIYGVGGNDTKKVIQLIKDLNLQEFADCIMVAAPYYNKPSQRGLVQHFDFIFNNFKNCSFMLYNVPSRTGVNVEPETIFTLSKLNSNLIGVKEASGDINQITKLKYMLVSSNVKVFSGDDKIALPLYSVGCNGVISVASNVFPKEVLSIFKKLTIGDLNVANVINKELFEFYNLLFCDTNPVPLKFMLSLKYNDNYSHVRSPLCQLEEENKKLILQAIKNYYGNRIVIKI